MVFPQSGKMACPENFVVGVMFLDAFHENDP
jgi:hypothetical protein